MTSSAALICEAIRTRSLLAFDYRGLRRVAAPYCHGISTTGNEVMRAVQLGGASKSGGIGVGKLWLVSELVGARILPETFVPDDPHYNPADRAMTRIHCHV